ncbi:probable G-protein coupled receptor Mth-like 11 [Drosophila nasuta]|uniref:probable G-protein coupled receptor Mth-like 11 n=1 Tax=Drosophila nasuta TaxID=42062 RepID=UPI00295EA50F|nr:probable G-protein coupled receptor Mth-like 11 [Drosophila nasuta]
MFIIRRYSAFLFIILSIILAAEAEDNQKCEYFESVDLENSQKCDYGSYLYRSILIPNEKEKNERKECLIPHKPDSKIHIELHGTNIIRVITVFCIAIIIAAYCYSPKLNAGSNRCYIYHFVCLASCYILQCVDLVGAAKNVCYLLGYSRYFIIMSTFLWLLVINYNLWNAITRYKVSVHMLRYHIFVWGSAAILTAITAYMDMQEMSDSDRDIWQPGVTRYGCWIDTKNWSAMIYLYGPILLSILINSTLAIVTARHLYVHHMKTNQAWNNSERKNNSKNISDTICRLFLISGVFWLMEIFAYLFNIELFALIKAGQGLILPFVTICNKKVIRDLNKRLNPKRKKDCEPVTTME